jgi:hypothetical protein
VQAKMTKKLSNILIGLLSFLTGVLVAWFTVGQVRQVIRSFYQWTTGNAFQFHGKHIIINLDPIYYLTFGLAVLTLWYCLKGLTLNRAIIWTGISTILIIATAVVYAWVDGNLTVISCTMCDDEIVRLHWNDLNYNLVSELSLLIGLTPLIIRTIRKRKKSQHTTKPIRNAG